jgi:hypothetical protein
MSAQAKHFLVQKADVSKKETREVVCSHSTGRPITSIC